MENFKNKKVLVFGLGLLGGGVATTNWLIKHGARVTVTDLKDENYLEPSLKRLKGRFKLRLNGHDKKDVEDNEIIVFNPDVSINNPFVKYAQKISRQIENEATIFYKLCPRPIIAVTGTRGKTTTANWVGHFLNPVRSLARAKSASPVRESEQYSNTSNGGGRGTSTLSNGTSPEDLGEATSNGVNASYKTVVSGNSYIEPLLKTLDRASRFDYVVNEIPSYHSEFFSLAIPAPEIAAITNLYQDHLNRHKTMKNYALTKSMIFKNQSANQHLILNYDNKWTTFFLKQKPRGQVWFFSLSPLPQNTVGAFYKNDRLRKSTNDKIYFRQGNGVETGIGIGSFVAKWGEHNLANLLASSLAAHLAGVSWDKIQQKIKTLPQIPFRQETVFENKRLKIINDTSATSPDGGIAAINRFASPSTILITGGTDRQLDYKQWANVVTRKLKPENVIFLAGSATDKMLAELTRPGLIRGRASQIDIFETLSECVVAALTKAGKYPKSVILFSPAAKSFEKFKNEFDRGRQFNRLVKKLVKK